MNTVLKKAVLLNWNTWWSNEQRNKNVIEHPATFLHMLTKEFLATVPDEIERVPDEIERIPNVTSMFQCKALIFFS